MRYGKLNDTLAGMIANEIDPIEFGSKVRRLGIQPEGVKVTRTRSQRRSTLNAAMQSPPVVMKLISRVNNAKDLNNLIHYLNKDGTVCIIDQHSSRYDKSNLNELYIAWKDNIGEKENQQEEFNNLDKRHYINYSKSSNEIIYDFAEVGFDAEKVKGIMKNYRKQVHKRIKAIGADEDYIRYAWNKVIFQVDMKLAKIKNQESQKNRETKIVEKLSLVRKRAQKYKTPERNIARHGMITFPVGTKEEKTLSITRAALARFFTEDQVDYFMAAHTQEDGENPHVHFVFSSKCLDGKKIDLQKKDVFLFREAIADEAERQGIHLHAGKAWERGVRKMHIPRFVLKKMAQQRAEQNPELSDELLYQEVLKDLQQEKIEHAKSLGLKPTEAELKFKSHITQQTKVLLKDAAFYQQRFEEQGNELDRKRSDLIKRHVQFLQKSQPERLKIIKQNEKNNLVSVHRNCDNDLSR